MGCPGVWVRHGGLTPRLGSDRPQPLCPHDQADCRDRHLDPVVVAPQSQLITPSFASRRRIATLDRFNQHVVTNRPRSRVFRVPPPVKRRPRYLQLLTQPHDRVVRLLCLDQLVEILYRCFAAKKALTFPKNSISAFSFATSANVAWCSSHGTASRSGPQNRPGFSALCLRTQFPRVPSFTPMSTHTPVPPAGQRKQQAPPRHHGTPGCTS